MDTMRVCPSKGMGAMRVRPSEGDMAEPRRSGTGIAPRRLHRAAPVTWDEHHHMGQDGV